METVLYYEPLPLLAPAALAGVLQRRGLRVVRVTRDQVGQSVGHLAGYQGFEAKAGTETWTPSWRISRPPAPRRP